MYFFFFFSVVVFYITLHCPLVLLCLVYTLYSDHTLLIYSNLQTNSPDPPVAGTINAVYFLPLPKSPPSLSDFCHSFLSLLYFSHLLLSILYTTLLLSTLHDTTLHYSIFTLYPASFRFESNYGPWPSSRRQHCWPYPWLPCGERPGNDQRESQIIPFLLVSFVVCSRTHKKEKKKNKGCVA